MLSGTFFSHSKYGPLRQAIFSVFLSFVAVGIGWISGIDKETVNILSVSASILYTFMNPVLSIFTQRMKWYILTSIPLFFLVLAVNILLYYLANGASPISNRSIVLIYLLLVLFYFMVYPAALLFRGIKSVLER